MSSIAKSEKESKKRKPLLARSPSKIENNPTLEAGTKGAAEFVESINTQLSKINFLNAKYLPISSIALDPNNPRELAIDIKDIISGPKLPEQPFDDEVQDEFKEQLKQFFDRDENKKQKMQDYFSIALLASTIRSPEKLMQPICVYERSNKYIVLAGERRTLAHYVMNAQYIAANIIDEPDSKEKAVMQYIENSAREDLSLKDKFNAIRKIIHYYGTTISVRSLANILKLSKSQAQKYAKICKEENILFIKAIETGVLTSPEDAYNLIKNNDADTISNICNLLLKGKGIEEIFKEINASGFHGKELIVKRIVGTNENASQKNNLSKRDEQIIFKGEDIHLLRKLIHIAIQAGKIKQFQEGAEKLGMTHIWEKIKEQMKKVS